MNYQSFPTNESRRELPSWWAAQFQVLVLGSAFFFIFRHGPSLFVVWACRFPLFEQSFLLDFYTFVENGRTSTRRVLCSAGVFPTQFSFIAFYRTK
jgi:hypothetical protein